MAVCELKRSIYYAKRYGNIWKQAWPSFQGSKGRTQGDEENKTQEEEIMPAGRPSEYTPELADEICARISSGDSIRTICNNEDMPCAQSLYTWIRLHNEFLEQYTRAKEDQADAFAEEILDIADDSTNDWMHYNADDDEDAGWKVNQENIQRSKLRIDSRKWLASKFKAKKYGDSTQLKLADADGNKIEEINVNFIGRDTNT